MANGSGEPLRRGRRIDLGTIEKDISGIEIVRYVAPILLIKPVDEAGNIVRDCQPVLTYTNPEAEGEELTDYTVGGNVSLEKQRDGRWRSSQLLPDEPFKVTVDKEGYACEPQHLSMAEGDEHELQITIKKSPHTNRSPAARGLAMDNPLAGNAPLPSLPAVQRRNRLAVHREPTECL